MTSSDNFQGPSPSENVAPAGAPVLVLAIGGLDPTGGAGLVRDFLTGRTLGVAVRLIPTAWTEQSLATGVRHIEPRDPRALSAAIRDAMRSASRPGGDARPPALAVKIGMLPDDASVGAVHAGLEGFAGPVVLDPVLAASSGGAALFGGDLEGLVKLGGRATLMTPNADEASALTGLPVRTAADAHAAGIALHARGVAAVLIKGGHLAWSSAGGAGDVAQGSPDDVVVDTLVQAVGVRVFRSPRISGPPVRGTGCALATAIAVGLGRGFPIESAVSTAKQWLAAALSRPVSTGGEWHLP